MTNLLRSGFLSLIVLWNVLLIDSQQSRKFFRKDYTYLEGLEAFYKFHTVSKKWPQARERCEAEGGILFHPNDENEYHTVAAYWNLTQPYNSIFVGLSDVLVNEVFMTADGKTADQVYHHWARGEPQGTEHCVTLSREDGSLKEYKCDLTRPFICKKALAELEWNKDCDMPRMDYVYNPSLGRCYKVHTDLQNWSNAVAKCYAEDAYLAIINSEVEAEYLAQIARRARRPNTPDWIHMGFHRFGGPWKTVKAQSLESTGYLIWEPAQPDDAGGTEFCGSIYYSGRLNDLTCSIHCNYICEHEIESRQYEIDERDNDLLFNFGDKP